MRYGIFSICLFFICATGTPAHAETSGSTITLRTGIVEAINSLTLTHSEVSVIARENARPIALFKIDFSLQAFEGDLFIPDTALWETHATSAPHLGYMIETRNGDSVQGGYSVGMIIPEVPSTQGFHHIPKGETRMYSLYVAFTDKVLGQEYRVRVSNLTMGTLAGAVELNPSEVGQLQSEYTEL